MRTPGHLARTSQRVAAARPVEKFGLETVFLAVVVNVAIGVWLLVLLAEFGVLESRLLATAMIGLAFATLTVLRRIGVFHAAARTTSGVPRHGEAQEAINGATLALAVAAVLVLCAILFFPPYETFVWASDSSVYLSLGPEIARNGGYVLHDPLLAEVTQPTRSELFQNQAALDATGAFARFPGGFAIPDIEEPTVVAGFSPVFPALLAVVYDVLGLRAMPYVAPVFATLSMIALLLVGYRMGGTVAGLGAALLATVTMPQIWFAKYPMSEIVAELFVLAALLALLLSLRSQLSWLAAIAGWLLGVAALAKFELIPIVAVTITAFAGVKLVWTGRWLERGYLWLAVCFAVPTAHAAIHYALLPSHYTGFVQREISSNYLGQAGGVIGWRWLAVGMVVLGGVLIFVLSRVGGGLRANLDRPRLWGFAMISAVTAYFPNDGSVDSLLNNPVGVGSGLAEIVSWLSWYLLWPFFVTLAAATAVCVFRRIRPPERLPENAGTRADRDRGSNLTASRDLSTFVVVLVVVACMHLYRSPDTDEHIWAMRRFVPVVIPCLALLTSTMTVAALRNLDPRRGPVIAAVVLLALMALAGAPSASIVGQPLWQDTLEETGEIAALLPEGSVVLVSAQLAGTHLATTLNYVHGVQAVVVYPILPTFTALGELVAAWIEDGRPVFLITSEQVFSFYAPELSLIEIDRRILEISVLERTRGRLPRQIVNERAPLTIGRLVARGETATTIDVGNLADDVFFQLLGFYSDERDLGRAGSTFRWTSRRSSLLVPRSGGLTLVLSGARPAGVPPARISISVDGELVLANLEVSDEPTEIILDDLAGVKELSAGRDVRPRELVLYSTVFSPAQTGISTDERLLGVRLYRVDMHDGG